MQIRSYVRAFPADRRIYRIDRWSIPVPGGLPLAASAWFVALAIVMCGVGQLPGIDRAVAMVGWPAATIVLPGAGAVALTRRCNDGRTLPRLAAHRLAFALRGDCRSARTAIPLPQLIRVAGDLSLPGRARVLGPGRVTLPTWTRVRVLSTARILVDSGAVAVRERAVVVMLAAGDAVEVRA